MLPNPVLHVGFQYARQNLYNCEAQVFIAIPQIRKRMNDDKISDNNENLNNSAFIDEYKIHLTTSPPLFIMARFTLLMESAHLIEMKVVIHRLHSVLIESELMK